MSYISRSHVLTALQKMRHFHTDLEKLHRSYGLSLLENTGRRNILMSSTQEEFFARALSKDYDDVLNNGKTGEPDIVVGELNKEIECKITTPNPSGGISLQTDYATLAKKGDLDYLYVVADKQFEKFVVLHYTGLSIEDFSIPSQSSRGKAKLIKHIAEKKCNVLWGSVRSKNQRELEKRRKELSMCSKNAPRAKEKLQKSIDYWTNEPTHFVYEFEGVS